MSGQKVGKRGKFQLVLVVLWVVFVILLASDKLSFVSSAMGIGMATTTTTAAVTIEESPLVDEQFLERVADGKVSGIEFGLGATRERIVSEWGTPCKVQDNGTHELLYYETQGCFFSIDKSTKQVLAIGLYGTRLADLTAEQVKEIAGTPYAEEGDAMDGSWLTMYRAGDNEVYLNSQNENSPITSWLLKAQ